MLIAAPTSYHNTGNAVAEWWASMCLTEKLRNYLKKQSCSSHFHTRSQGAHSEAAVSGPSAQVSSCKLESFYHRQHEVWILITFFSSECLIFLYSQPADQFSSTLYRNLLHKFCSNVRENSMLATAMFFVQIRRRRFKTLLNNLIWLLAIILNLHLIPNFMAPKHYFTRLGSKLRSPLLTPKHLNFISLRVGSFA